MNNNANQDNAPRKIDFSEEELNDSGNALDSAEEEELMELLANVLFSEGQKNERKAFLSQLKDSHFTINNINTLVANASSPPHSAAPAPSLRSFHSGGMMMPAASLSSVSDVVSSSVGGIFDHFTERLKELIEDFVYHFSESPFAQLITPLTKKWSWLSDKIMVAMMRTGLLVDREQYSAANNSSQPPFRMDYYVRTLKPRDHTPNYKGTPRQVVDRIFTRHSPRLEKTKHSCLLWPWFAQWFVEEFFKTGEKFTPDLQDKDGECQVTWSGHQIDLSTLYGATPERTDVLREKHGGRLRTQLIEGEEYPLYWQSLTADEKKKLPILIPDTIDDGKKAKLFALGHPRQNLHVGLIVINTIFMREHNRICKHLAERNPRHANDDDWLFATTRSIMTALLLKMVLNDYIQHINPASGIFNFYFKPSLLNDIPEWRATPQTHRIAEEFNLLYRWHALIPDDVVDLHGHSTSVPDTFFNSDYVTTRGISALVRAAVAQPINAFGAASSPSFLAYIDESGVRQARERMQLRGFNEYAIRYGATPIRNIHKSFPREVSDAVYEIYNGNADDVEFFVGIMNQNVTMGIFPDVLRTMVLAHAMHGIFSNGLLHDGKDWNKKKFDDGKYGFEVFNESDLASLFARNTNLSKKEIALTVIPL